MLPPLGVVVSVIDIVPVRHAVVKYFRLKKLFSVRDSDGVHGQTGWKGSCEGRTITERLN